jgi:hypothetical protein
MSQFSFKKIVDDNIGAERENKSQIGEVHNAVQETEYRLEKCEHGITKIRNSHF